MTREQKIGDQRERDYGKFFFVNLFSFLIERIEKHFDCGARSRQCGVRATDSLVCAVAGDVSGLLAFVASAVVGTTAKSTAAATSTANFVATITSLKRLTKRDADLIN